MTARRTVNLQDYNSLTYEVSVEEDLPVGKRKKEHLDTMFDQVNNYLTKKFLESGVIEE